jgi:DNA primase
VASLGVKAHEKYLPIGSTAREYAHQRGLTDETIERFRVGQDRMYMTIPSFRDGRLRGIKKRNCTDRGLRYVNESGSRGDLFNVDEVRFFSGHVFIVKGEIPAMLLSQEGFKAVAPTGGEGSWDERWKLDLGLARLTLIGDNDEFGKQAGYERSLGFGAALAFPPSEFKDVDMYMLARPEEAMEWLKTLAV